MTDICHDAPAKVPPATPPRALGGVLGIAAAAFLLEMAVSTRYGYHRDELYFLEAGRHLAFGYVDQPPLTPLAARLSWQLFGGSLPGLRLLPALCLGALVVLTAAMSRLLGAGRTGQTLAAACTATCGEYLATAHLLSTTTLDFVFSATLLLLVLHLLASGDTRWWLAIGACVGIGAEAKWNIAYLAASVLAGLLLTPQRRLLRSGHAILGAGMALGLAAPDLAWQAVHHWPNLDVFAALQGAAGHNRLVYWPAQLLYTGVALTPIWIAGLRWSLRDPRATRFRPAGLAAGIALVAMFLLGGKPYYAGAVFTFLFAAGAVRLEHLVTPRRGSANARTARRSPLARLARLAGARKPPKLVLAMTLSFALALPVALPVLPAASLRVVALQKINYDLGETIGWQGLVTLVADEYHALPASQRSSTAILTGNYGEAGALDRYGAGLGLPPAYCGQNNYWLWGPPPAADRSAIAINIDPSLLRRAFTHVTVVAIFANGLGVSDDEEGAATYLVSGPRSSWSGMWAEFRHYD